MKARNVKKNDDEDTIKCRSENNFTRLQRHRALHSQHKNVKTPSGRRLRSQISRPLQGEGHAVGYVSISRWYFSAQHIHCMRRISVMPLTWDDIRRDIRRSVKEQMSASRKLTVLRTLRRPTPTPLDTLTEEIKLVHATTQKHGSSWIKVRR